MFPSPRWRRRSAARGATLRTRHHQSKTKTRSWACQNIEKRHGHKAEEIGWTAYDAGRHGLAMRYFTQGLRLAREANDHLSGGRMLSSLSHQANFLGRYNDAVQFARAAQSATQGRATNTVTTMFLAMEARALASVGDAVGSAAALNRAEALFDTRDPSKEPEWIGYFDELELAGEASHCFRDLGDSRQTKYFTDLAIDPQLTPARTRAFIQMVSAEGSLSSGDVDEAIALAEESIHLSGGIQSARYVRYLTDFHASLSAKSGSRGHAEKFGSLLQATFPTVALPKSA